MDSQPMTGLSRRQLLGELTLVGTAGLLGLLKAADVCGTAPEQAAQFMVDKGFTPSDTITPYRRCRNSLIISGANTTLRIRCASTLCACTS
jgi:hypothetical protein